MVVTRRMGPGDAGLLDRVARDVLDGPVSAAGLRALLAEPGHLLVLALDGGTVVGQCAGVVHHHPDKAADLYVDEVATAATHLRRGVATAMLREIFAWARERGCAGAWLATEPDNEAANALYEGLGSRTGTARVHEFDL